MTRNRLDNRDIAILAVLSREGRISKADLARRVNLSATPCWQRLRRLEAAGLIRGYRADVALDRIAPHVTVFVTIELENHRAENFRVFEQAIAGLDEVVGCWSLGGGYDYLMQVVTRDVAAYQALIDPLLEPQVGLKRYFSYIVTKEVKMGGVPPFDVLLDTNGST
jgi:Lrp/AsnC family transcriptional regulator, regulator of ectoine-degradation genes